MSTPGMGAESNVLVVPLRHPGWAAFWAWLWPGAGHLYQGRYAKGLLLMACILSTYFAGLIMGGGHVVYASFTKHDRRWQYICQVGVGLPALPALVQSYRVLKLQKPPLFGDIMAPPFPVRPNAADKLAAWHRRYHQYFELGTLYTMIAGLLNVLAIFDAYHGPFILAGEQQRKDERSASASAAAGSKTAAAAKT